MRSCLCMCAVHRWRLFTPWSMRTCNSVCCRTLLFLFYQGMKFYDICYAEVAQDELRSRNLREIKRWWASNPIHQSLRMSMTEMLWNSMKGTKIIIVHHIEKPRACKNAHKSTAPTAFRLRQIPLSTNPINLEHNTLPFISTFVWEPKEIIRLIFDVEKTVLKIT